MSQLFVEVVIAPAYDSDALERFSRKKNLRVIEMPQQSDSSCPLDLRSIQARHSTLHRRGESGHKSPIFAELCLRLPRGPCNAADYLEV